MRPYSPSQTKAFMENPIIRDLEYVEGWSVQEWGNREKAMIAGTGAGEGILEHYRDKAGIPRLHPSDRFPVQIASESVLADLTHAQAEGFTWREDCPVDNLAQTVSKAVERYIDKDMIPKEWIADVEPTMPDHGNCRPDLIFRAPYLMPCDVKFKLTMQEDRLAQTLSEFAYDWQMLHYAWATAGHYKEPVKNYGIILVRANPFKVWPHFVPIKPELMDLWYISARSVWAVMAAVDGDTRHLTEWIGENSGVLPSWHTFKFYGRYGRDPFSAAVLDYNLDETILPLGYNKRTRRQPAPRRKEEDDIPTVH